MSTSLELCDLQEEELDQGTLGDDNPDLERHLGLRQAAGDRAVFLDLDLEILSTFESLPGQGARRQDLLPDSGPKVVSLGSGLETGYRLWWPSGMMGLARPFPARFWPGSAPYRQRLSLAGQICPKSSSCPVGQDLCLR